MLIAFFDVEGIMHYEYVPQGQTVKQGYYIDVLKRLRSVIQRNKSEKWRTVVDATLG